MASLATLRKLLDPKFLSDSTDPQAITTSPNSLADPGNVAPTPTNYAPTVNRSAPNTGWVGEGALIDTSGLKFSDQYGPFATQANALDKQRTNADYNKREAFRLSDEQFGRDVSESDRMKKLAQRKLLERMAGQGILQSGITLEEGSNLQGDFARYLDDLNYEHTNRSSGIQKGFIDYVNSLAGQKQGLFGQQQQAEQSAKLAAAKAQAEAEARQRQEAQMQAMLQQQQAQAQANAQAQADQQAALIAALNSGRSSGGYGGMPGVSGGGGGSYVGGSGGGPAPSPAPNQDVGTLSWEDLVSRSNQARSGSHGAAPLQQSIASALNSNAALRQQVWNTYNQFAGDVNRVGYSYINPTPSFDELVNFMMNPQSYKDRYISPTPL